MKVRFNIDYGDKASIAKSTSPSAQEQFDITKAVYQSIKNAGLFGTKVRYMPRWYEAVPVPLCEYTMDKFAEVMLDSSKLKQVMKDIDDYRAKMK